MATEQKIYVLWYEISVLIDTALKMSGEIRRRVLCPRGGQLLHRHS